MGDMENSFVHTQQCDYWCPGALAPGHQYSQCWTNIHCIGPVSDKNITLYSTLKTEKKMQNIDSVGYMLRVKTQHTETEKLS